MATGQKWGQEFKLAGLVQVRLPSIEWAESCIAERTKFPREHDRTCGFGRNLQSRALTGSNKNI